MSGVHIFYGHAKRRDPSRPRCNWCNKRPREIAFTYFGMPLCRDCWDGKWRSQEDGECDPPFDGIKHEQTGEWLVGDTEAGR